MKRCVTMSCTADGSLHCFARFCMACTASSASCTLFAFSWPETHSTDIYYNFKVTPSWPLSACFRDLFQKMQTKLNKQASFEVLLAMAFPISMAYWLRSRVRAEIRQETAGEKTQNVLISTDDDLNKTIRNRSQVCLSVKITKMVKGIDVIFALLHALPFCGH